MSRIDDLIQELCPSGVEYKQLGDVGRVVRGKRFVKDDMIDAGVPCVHYGEIYTKYGISAVQSISYVSHERARTLRFAQQGDVIMASAGETIEDIGKSVAWLGSEPIAIHDACYAFSSSMDPKFVSYFFASRFFRDQIRRSISSSKISSISTQNVAKARIPVPPLEVQREIVRVLDTFTQLEAELEAELEARRAQYDYYFNDLLSFGADEAQELTLGDIGRVAMCKRVFKSETRDSGGVPFYKIGTFGGHPDAYISRDLFDSYREKFSFPSPGDVLISAAGTIGRTVVYDGEAAYFQDSNIVWLDHDESIVTNAYLKHWYKVIEWTTDGGTIRRLYNSNLLRARILVPPFAEQDRIAKMLDKFDALVNDINIGLPAELAARRKQYEHYRDRLLAFKELAS